MGELSSHTRPALEIFTLNRKTRSAAAACGGVRIVDLKRRADQLGGKVDL